MNGNDRDTRLEELLRDSLSAEADTVTPAGDGLARIQGRVGARRGRALWLKPLGALGGLAVVAAAGFGAYALTRSSGPSTDVAVTGTPSPTASSSPSSTPSTPPVPVAPTFPSAAFYPFTSAAAEKAWEQQGGPAAQPWVLDPVQEATLFIANFVRQPSVATVSAHHSTSTTASVTLGRYITDGGSHHFVAVTTVRMAKFGKAWVVIGADDPNAQLRMTTPRAGALVTSPLVVSGPAYGVDEAVRLDVRSLAGDAAPRTVATASFGNGSPPWSVSLSFNIPSDPAGAVVAVEPSAADTGPGRIVVTGVRFDTTQAADYASVFYGIKNGRVATFSSRTGASLSYLTVAQPTGVQADPQRVGNEVFYLQGNGVCGNALTSVVLGSSTPQTVATPRAGYVISSYAVSADGTRIATFETACAPTPAQPQGLLVARVRGTSTTHVVPFQAFPPTVVGDPSWLPDDRHLVTVVQTGTLADVRTYDAFAAHSWDDTTAACGTAVSGNGLPKALQVDGTGAVWFATQTGTSMQVTRCFGGTSSVAFTVTGNDTPRDLAVNGNGSAALLADQSGKVWRWSRHGGVVELAPSVALLDVSW